MNERKTRVAAVPAAEQVGGTRWATVVTSALATLLVSGELAMTAFALPLIGQRWGLSAGTTAWVLLAYQVPLAALALAAGRWVDRADLRTAYFLSLGGIALTSLVAGLAPAFWVLLLVRPVQGLAAALYLAVYLPVITASVAERQRGRAMSYHTTVMMVGSMAEGPVGGWVADAWGWRAVFLVKVPFLLLMLALGYVTIPAGRRGESVAAGPRRWSPSEVVLVGSAVAAVLFALQQPAGRRLLALALLVAAAVLVAGWTRLPAAAPVVGLIRRRSFGLPVLALMLIASISGLMTFALPYFISDVLRHGPEALGVALLCFVAAGALVSPIAGALTDRHGAGRVAFAGGVLTVAGVLPLATLDAGAGAFDLSWRMAILGAGMALFNSPNMTSILQATPDGQGGTVGGVTNVGRTLGTTLGPALAALAWTASGGGLAGFRTAVAVLAGCAATGAFALLLARRPDASRKPAPSP